MTGAILAAKPTRVNEGHGRYFRLWNGAVLPSDWADRVEPIADELRNLYGPNIMSDPLTVAWARTSKAGATVLAAWSTTADSPFNTHLTRQLAALGWGVGAEVSIGPTGWHVALEKATSITGKP